jgi:hypothetical protein
MRPFPRRRRQIRSPRFESIEPRVVLSTYAHPAGEPGIDAVVEQPAAGEIFPALIEAHQLTELAQARERFALTGQGQTVAIIDSGVAYEHAALGGGFGSQYQVVGGFDFTGDGDPDPYDAGPYGSHGTHVAGIIASNDAYYPGVAPGVDLVALRVFDDAGQGRFEWVEEALRWVHENRNAFENPITTVNLSVGKSYNDLFPPPDASLEDELAQLEADGIFISVAAGNSFTTFNAPGLSYPAASSHVVPVSSVDDSGRLSYFTQRHPQTLAAPGRGVMSTVPDYMGNRNGVDDDFARYSGTSMAAPYVAGASVLVREAYELVGVTGATQTMLYDLMYSTADVIHDDVTGLDYRRLNLGRAIDRVMQNDDAGSTPLEPAGPDAPGEGEVPADTTHSNTDSRPDLPEPRVVAQTELPDNRITESGQWFAFRASQSGLFTVQASFKNADGDVDLELYDADQQRLGGSCSTGDRERIDMTVTAGQTVYLEVRLASPGVNPDVDLSVTNLVALDGETVRVAGTEGDDRFSFTPGTTHDLVINGVSYRLESAVVTTVIFDGLAGSDTAILNGTTRSDAATIRVGSADLSGPGYRVQATGVENVAVNGAGGSDTAILYDSPGDDTFSATYDDARLVGAGFEHRATGFQTVHAYATAGGHDTAELYDSPGNDTLVATPTFGKLFGDGFFRRAKFFEAVHGYATEGGDDVARLYGSSGDDLFVATPLYGKLSGTEYVERAKFFDEVTAWGGSGGNDKVIFYDSPGNDVYTAHPNWATLEGEGFAHRAFQFGVAYAFASAGGHDVADLYDSDAGDTFYSTGTDVRLFGEGFYNRAKAFEEVHAHGSGGEDRAHLYDTAMDDHFHAVGRLGKLSNSSLAIWLDGFDYVRVLATRGGSDTVQREAVDYVLDLMGDWEA